MRLGISTVGVDDGPSGTRSRLEGLVPALLAADAAVEVVLYLPRGCAAPVAEEGPRVRHVETPFRPRRAIRRWLAASWWERRLTADGADLLLADYHPVPRDTPALVTVHDLRALRGSGSLARRLWTRRLLPRALARAAGVVVPSRTVAREVEERLGVAVSRIHVVPNAPGDDLRPDGPVESLRPVGPAEDPREPFVLHVGPDVSRKNLDALRLSPVAVVLAGRPPLRDGAPFRPVGPVCRDRLGRLLRGALALVLPSRDEGSGLPALEAMACGTPVLAARAGALPETTRGAAGLLDPDDAVAWAGAIERLLEDPARRVQMAAEGRRMAAGLTWAGSARVLLAAIYSAVPS